MIDNGISKLDKNQILAKITSSLGDNMKNAFSWIHGEEGQIIFNSISQLTSYVVGDPTGVLMPFIFQSTDLVMRKRLLKRVPDLLHGLDEQRDQFDQDFLKSSIGQDLLRKTLQELIEQESDEKAEAHKQFLLNAFSTKDVSRSRIETFMKILVSLEPLDLQVLRVFYDPSNLIKQITERNKKDGIFSFNLQTDFRHFLGIEQGLFDRSITRLETDHLIATQGMLAQWSSGSYAKEYFEAGVQRATEDASRMITPLGKDFVKFVIAT